MDLSADLPKETRKVETQWASKRVVALCDPLLSSPE